VNLAGNSGEMPAMTRGGAVMDIVVWLRSLGLGKYEAAFRENDIDETVLPSLTHENLKELGVTSLGHRVEQVSRHAPPFWLMHLEL
jgi:SAM domain (Sterile alpha motif)